MLTLIKLIAPSSRIFLLTTGAEYVLLRAPGRSRFESDEGIPFLDMAARSWALVISLDRLDGGIYSSVSGTGAEFPNEASGVGGLTMDTALIATEAEIPADRAPSVLVKYCRNRSQVFLLDAHCLGH